MFKVIQVTRGAEGEFDKSAERQIVIVHVEHVK